MAEEKKEKWTNYLAITTVIIAVCATMSTFKGGGYGSRSLMNQTKASDQWAYYQSKSVKSYIFEMQKDNLALQQQVLAKSGSDQDIMAKYHNKISNYETKIRQYEADKDSITAEARRFEKERDDCKNHSTEFGIAVIFLQISILLSSISALTKKKFVWYFSLVVGLVGIFYFINGFILFVI